MARCLILTWNGAGNQNPAVGLAQHLAREGHAVTFAGTADQQPLIASHGFAFETLSTRPLAPDRPRFEFHVVNSWANGAHLQDLERLLEHHAPDGLVVDCMMFGVLAAAERLGRRATVLAHSTPNALVPAGGPLESLLMDPVNRVRADMGLSPIGSLQAAWAPFRTICASLPELDPPGPTQGVQVEFVGPLFDQPANVQGLPSSIVEQGAPLVLVSFSTGRAWDQRSRISRTAAALADAPLRAIFTTGLADVSAIQPPANGVFVPHAPHGSVLPHAALTITHAGHGTVLASLAAGVPLICLPNPGVDQGPLAARIQDLGAGLALDGEHVTAGEIRRAIETVANDPTFARRAAELSLRVRAARPVDLIGEVFGIGPAHGYRLS